MSWNVYLMVDTGGPEPAVVADVGNHTTNTAGMWDHAWRVSGDPFWGDWTSFGDYLATKPEGWLAGDITANILKEMLKNPDTYRALNPDNGWGSYESALKFLFEIRLACALHPNAYVSLSR
jgi:hypothetical protein